MHEDGETVGTVITLAELKALGELVRWQELGPRVADLVAADALPAGYPVVPSRLPGDLIDLWDGERWREVAYVAVEEGRHAGDRQILYRAGGVEHALRYDADGVAPAGHFTGWSHAPPASLDGAALSDGFRLTWPSHRMKDQELERVDWPYLTFRVRSYDRNARWVDESDMRTSRCTVHAADPRVTVEGVASRASWFNTRIAVSHRWLASDHPDPDGAQVRELIALADALGLDDRQALLLDYCSLPQHPRSPEDDARFRERLPRFQERFKSVALVLSSGSDDYATRAWCMLELMLAAMSRRALLNHDRLDQPLADAVRLGQRYVEESGWNQRQMQAQLGGGVTHASVQGWLRDPVSAALYQATNQGKDAILGRFEHDLEVTVPDDRRLIRELLERLVFQR